MKRLVKFIVPAMALGLFALVPSPLVRADDAPAATQPAKATGSVTVRVVDAQGNPVEGANVQIVTATPKGGKKKDPTAAKTKPESFGEGKTDAQGLVTITDIPEGSYRATTKVKGEGNGREDVIVTANAPAVAAAPVTITLKAKKNAAPPATQPA